MGYETYGSLDSKNHWENAANVRDWSKRFSVMIYLRNPSLGKEYFNVKNFRSCIEVL